MEHGLVDGSCGEGDFFLRLELFNGRMHYGIKW